MITATKRIHGLILREIELRGTEIAADARGDQWDQLTPAEEAVFGLGPDELPSLVVIWSAYESVTALWGDFEIGDDLLSAFLAEHPFCAARRQARHADEYDFVRFAALFGCPNRSATKWWLKYMAFCMRIDAMTFRDEAAQPVAYRLLRGDEDDGG